MITFRGDVHKFYLKIKRTVQANKPISDIHFIQEINEIKKFYQTLSYEDLKKIRYRIVKERNGSGVIPILVSTIPWLGLIFSKQIQTFIEKNLMFVILGLILYTMLVFGAIILHFKEQAWAYTHSEIIDDILKEKLPKISK